MAAQSIPRRMCDVVGGSVSSVKLSVTSDDGELIEIDLPVLVPTMGPPVIDVRTLYARTGLFTHDPGFTATSSCESAITYIDGPKGVLLHRGYSIEDLAAHSTYLELCFLLLNGNLPDSEQMSAFERAVKGQWMLHEKLKNFFLGFKDGSHPMAIMVGVVGALSSFQHSRHMQGTQESRAKAAVEIIAKMPTIAAMAYKTAMGEPYVYPDNSLSFAHNFLRMMFSTPCEPYEPPKEFVDAMDLLLILHADHEQNASTSTVRIAGSSDADPFACIAAGIASLWGPSHGGANEAVVKMLRAIGTVERIPAFIEKAKDKKDPFKLMGFGHRVYKNYDPRATQMKIMCHNVVAICEQEDPELRTLLELAMELEKIACADEYFIKRGLFPNVDFYSGITLTAMGIPTEMFTVLFAVGRSAGWIAQWKESIDDPIRKIYRPRQLYKGEEARPYPPLRGRVASGGDLSAEGEAAEAEAPFTDAYVLNALKKQASFGSVGAMGNGYIDEYGISYDM